MASKGAERAAAPVGRQRHDSVWAVCKRAPSGGAAVGSEGRVAERAGVKMRGVV